MREFASYPNGAHYTCQEKSWMDKVVMASWVEIVLKPYVLTAPDGVIPVLLLDSYRTHMMREIVTKIQELGVEVYHIPGGCTPHCQPVDIGFNKSLKSKLRDVWDEWMLSTWDSQTNNAPKAT